MKSHSVLSVDKKEVNPISCPGYDWYVPDVAEAGIRSLNIKNNFVTGSHRGFSHLKNGGNYTRQICLEKDGALRLVDKLFEKGRHLLEWRFVLAPGLSFTADNTNAKVGIYEGKKFFAELSYDPKIGLQVKKEKTNYAWEYGRWSPVSVTSRSGSFLIEKQ